MHPNLFKSEIFPFTQCTCPLSAHVQVQLLKVIIVGKENLDNANRHTSNGSVCSSAVVKLADPTCSFRIYHLLLHNVQQVPSVPPSPRLCTIRLVTQLDWSPCQRVPTEHTSPVNLILKMASSSSISSGNSAKTQGRPFFSKGILKWDTEILGKVHLDVTVVPTQCRGTHWNLMFNASNECGWFVQSNG